MPDVLRVATANAAGGRDRTGAAGAAQWERWAAAAATLDVDVLGVQEVDHLLPRSGAVDQTTALAAALAAGEAWESRFAAAVHGTPGSAATFRAAGASPADEPSYGVALLSRHPVRRWAELRLTPSRARLPVLLPPGGDRGVLWVPDEPRVALAAVVAAPAGDVTVVTTHLSFGPWRAVPQLWEVVRWVRDLPGPRVLLGDLNLPGRLAAGVSGWTPALRAPTYPASAPRVQLDHVLVDGPTSVRSATTRTVGHSDHLALRAELVVARGGA